MNPVHLFLEAADLAACTVTLRYRSRMAMASAGLRLGSEYRLHRAHTGLTCNWTQDSDGNWDTSCGHKFIIIAGYPSLHCMAYCPYCGQPLAQHPHSDQPDQSAGAPA